MSIDRIIQMVINMVMRQVIGRSVNAGIAAVSNRSKTKRAPNAPEPQTAPPPAQPEIVIEPDPPVAVADRDQSAAAKEVASKAKQGAKLGRRMGRL